MKFKILAAALLLVSAGVMAQKKIDLEKPADNLTTFIKARGSLDPKEEVVFYASGNIYSFIPEQRSQLIFTFEMYNIARFEKTDTGYTMITREMLVYKDPKSGKILGNWYNPFIKDSVEVIHVWNDPVNGKLAPKDFYVDYARLGNDRICMYNDIPLLYPSPLKKADWPQSSRSDLYQAAELFQFFFSEKEAAKPKVKNVNCDVSWTRFSDFLPWMKMGDKPGYLMYQSRGYKVMGGFNGLPQNIKEFVLANNPIYAHAPEKYSTPNMTSWKYYKKIIDERKKNAQ
jgi:Protein of unknown function (DUF1838)